jgi:hypothetical protein
MKVTKKQKRVQINKAKKAQRRASIKKERAYKLNGVKMSLMLTGKDGHVNTIREYLGTIEKDITFFSNNTEPAIAMMDLLCSDERLAAWVEDNRELVELVQDQIDLVYKVIETMRETRDTYAKELEVFEATSYKLKEDMVSAAFGIVMNISAAVDVARESYESVGEELTKNIIAIKPMIMPLIED